MIRAFTNILCDDVEKTAAFYSDLLGMERAGDFGWFVILCHHEMPGFELGILKRDHDSVPSALSLLPGAAILTFVVRDLEAVQERAAAIKAEIVDGPTDLEYGQRRLMLRDPAGTAVDVSAPIAPLNMA